MAPVENLALAFTVRKFARTLFVDNARVGRGRMRPVTRGAHRAICEEKAYFQAFS